MIALKIVTWHLIFSLKVLRVLGNESWSDNETEIFFPAMCRTELGILLPLEDYRLDTCARCYFYMPPWAFADGLERLSYDAITGLLYDSSTNLTYEADPENTSHPAYDTFQSDSFARKWIACCRAALDCCRNMISEPILMDNYSDSYCPRTWDGWQCWPDTPKGRIAFFPCQEHVYFRSVPPSCPRFATKKCLANGTWFINELDNEWSNYSGCGRIEGYRRLQYYHIITSAISVLFLIPALLIFNTYKQLQVYRITLHKNLFGSLLINAILTIFFTTIVILDELDHSKNRRTILEENGTGCKLLYVLTKYSRMTTYMWMLCEGFYLHKLIAASFAEQKSLSMFYFIGWVFPVFPVGTFALLRWYFADEECWAIPLNPYEWVTNSPNLLSLILNFAFLCNIIRVLVTKLRATHTNEPSQFRKAVRATLVLVPLFGLHFFLVIYRPQSGECSALEGYAFLSYGMDGFQGFLVALIFCYLNGEFALSHDFPLAADPRPAAAVLAEASPSPNICVFSRVAALHSLRTRSHFDGGHAQLQTGHRQALPLCQAVTELIKRSVYRFRLRYTLDIQPSSVTLSNLSELQGGVLRTIESHPNKYKKRSTFRRDSWSVEEITDLF